MAHPSPYLTAPISKVTIDKGQGRYKFAAANCQGWRVTQEDAHLAVPDFDVNTSLFAVFDGHNGPEVARYMAAHFAAYLKKNSNYIRGQVKRGVQEVFMELDEAVKANEDAKKELLKYRHEAGHKPAEGPNQMDVATLTGCTGVVLLIKNDIYYTANVGDSRCLLARDGAALQLSKDHKAEDVEEKARIEKAGGSVINGRINGIIDVSRAFGDHHFKANPQLNSKEQMITAWPFTDVRAAESTSDAFLVLICDGIWNAMANQEVVDFIKQRLAAKKKLEQIAEEAIVRILPKEMPSQGIAGKDNMTLMIIVMEPLTPKSKDASLKTNSKQSQKSQIASRKSSVDRKACRVKSKDGSKNTKKKSK